MSSVLDCVTFDCQDIRRVADFWAAALGYTFGETKEGWITLKSPSGQGPLIGFQETNESKRVKDRLHLDIKAVGSVEDEIQRLTALGATYEQRVDNDDGSWHVVMRDPEDNELCVMAQ